MYIYELPHSERRQLCVILDQNNAWEELAATHMRFDSTDIYPLRQELLTRRSPTDALLTHWGHQNHTMLELFILLNRMKHYQAMNVIKTYVDPKYHRLMRDDKENLNLLIMHLRLENQQHMKDRQIPFFNLNRKDERRLATEKGVQQLCQRIRPVEDKRLKPRNPFPPPSTGSSRGPVISDVSRVAQSAGSIPQIPYDDLQKSTDNWSEANLLGKGGFGKVFKGTWKCTQVAVKRIEQKEDDQKSRNEQIKQLITELHCLKAYPHDNVLPLYGYSVGGPQPCLVYQYMSGGCLESRLRIRDVAKALKWQTRLDIAIGTARGLQYIHTIGDKPLIHGDIKSANVLLDPNDVPRIGDFGLAREGPQSGDTHLTVSRIQGTLPYLPNEFLRGGKLSTKVDTYSFGIVLFEIATGLSAYSEHRKHKFLKDLIDSDEDCIINNLKDKRAADGRGIYGNLVEIGKTCVATVAKDRPEMVAVFMKLERVVR